MTRGKINNFIFGSFFFLIAFGVNLFAGGYCLFTVDEATGDEEMCFYFTFP